MMTLYRILPAFILLWVVLSVQTPVAAQEAVPVQAAASERPLIDINAKDLRDLGLGVLIFIVWFVDQRRQRSLEEIIKDYAGALKKYDETQQAHLAAFKDINERNVATFKEQMISMRELAEGYRENAVMCAQVNSTVGARLEQFNALMMKERSA